jgi:aspartate aminotransferase
MRQEFARRRSFTMDRLRTFSQISVPEPGGAFYAFFNVGRYFGRPVGKGTVTNNSTEFCAALLEQAHVALVSGDAFGAPGYVRLSFATSRQNLEAGFDRLGRFLRGE